MSPKQFSQTGSMFSPLLRGKNWIGNHLCLLASSHTFFITWHSLKRCSVDSMSPTQVRQTGSMFSPLFKRFPLVGVALWHSCHKKILIFSMVSMCQIHLNGYSEESFRCVPCVIRVADLVLKSSELFKPQQKESLVS